MSPLQLEHTDGPGAHKQACLLSPASRWWSIPPLGASPGPGCGRGTEPEPLCREQLRWLGQGPPSTTLHTKTQCKPSNRAEGAWGSGREDRQRPFRALWGQRFPGFWPCSGQPHASSAGFLRRLFGSCGPEGLEFPSSALSRRPLENQHSNPDSEQESGLAEGPGVYTVSFPEQAPVSSFL